MRNIHVANLLYDRITLAAKNRDETIVEFLHEALGAMEQKIRREVKQRVKKERRWIPVKTGDKS